MFDIFRNKNIKDIDVARNYFQKGNLKKAEHICNELLKENELNAEALYLLCQIYLRANNLSNYKDVSLKLLDVYINNDNNNSAIALFKKLNKTFPDDINLYNKIVAVYEKLNMRRELIQTLFALGDLYIKKELFVDASEVFVKLLNYNKLEKSVKVCFDIIDRFLLLDNRLMISLAVKDGIEYAREGNDKEALFKLIDIAAKYDCDIGEHIKISLDYFKTNKSNLDYFVESLINYFINICERIDMEFYRALLENFNYNELKDLIIKIHGKYKDEAVYKVECEIFAEKNDIDGLKYLLERIYSIENPSADLINFLSNICNKIKDARILYGIALYFIKCKNNIAANIILKKALEITENDEELRMQVMDRLNELAKTSEKITLEEPKVRNLEDRAFKKVDNINDIEESKLLPDIEITFGSKEIFEGSKENIEHINVEYNRALELIKNKSYKEAIDVLKPLIGSSKDFDILFNIALCYEILKEYDNAIKYYQMAIDSTDDVHYKCKLLMKIADIHFNLRDRERTYKTLYEIYRLNPNFVKHMFN